VDFSASPVRFSSKVAGDFCPICASPHKVEEDFCLELFDSMVCA
jgi:hypothetical protein